MIQLAGLKLNNIVCVAAGPMGCGDDFQDWQHAGAFFTQTLTLEPSTGNPEPRFADAPAGLINRVGLDNPGIVAFIEHKLPVLRTKGCPIVVSVYGSGGSELEDILDLLQGEEGISAIELNLSCPNVTIGASTTYYDVKHIVSTAGRMTKLPLIVKLGYSDNILSLAAAAEYSGADILSMINSYPVVGFVDGQLIEGGLSGPAIKHIALKAVHIIRQHGTTIPIIGIGGITSARDVKEFLAVGANAVAIGSGLMADPFTIQKIRQGLDS